MNTFSELEFLAYSLFWNTLGFVWYRNLILRNVFDLGTKGSNLVLLAVIIVINMINYLICRKFARNQKSVFAVMALSYGTYSLISYMYYMKSAYVVIIIVSVLIIVARLIYIFCRKISFHKDRDRVVRARRRRGYIEARDIAALACTVMVIATFVQTEMFGNLAKPTQVQPAQLYGDEYQLSNNLDMLMYLLPDEWEKLKGDTDKKLSVLQAVVNCEGRYLGYDKPISIFAGDLDDGTLGYYNHEDGTICIDIEHLDDPSQKVLESVLHECYHVAQSMYADIYRSLGGSDQRNYFMTDAAMYADEIDNYIGGERNYHIYYSQRLEADARAYSISASSIYFSRLEEYSKDKDSQKLTNMRTPLEASKERSIDELCVHQEPLVSRENIFNGNGVLTEYFTYEYDEKNRYRTVCDYQEDPVTHELELWSRDEYSYDDYVYYKDTFYAQKGNLVTHHIYDAHDNLIYDQTPNSDFTEISSMTYFYRYPVDTDSESEELQYLGEKLLFSNHKEKRFNEHGDEVFELSYSGDKSEYTNTVYKYDSKGRVISKIKNEKNKGMTEDDQAVYATTYTYDFGGKLDREIEKGQFIREGVINFNSEKKVFYEYDKDERLIRKIIARTTPGNVFNDTNSMTVIEYEYL